MQAPLKTETDYAAGQMRFGEFVALMACLMAVNALGIDTMLPALGQIGADLKVAVENHQQLVIGVYMGSFGVGQLVYGPLADRYGRRNIVLTALAVYAITALLAGQARTFDLLLAARAVQGFAAGSTRVLSTAIVRDCYSGRQMARVSSLCFMIFLSVPIVAPSIGQLVLLVAPWRSIFYGLAAFGLFTGAWVWFRLPETLAPQNVRPISLPSIAAAGREALTNRASIGYTLAGALNFGGLVGFLNSSQQIFAHTFHAPTVFPIAFGAAGVLMAIAALINSRVVERLGMRLVAHSAMTALLLISLVRLGFVATGRETMILFIVFQAVSMFMFALIGPNCGAVAMEPVGHIAGTASSVQGFLSTAIGTTVGVLIGQAFNGSTLPLTLGFMINALLGLIILAIAERGRLFRAHDHHPPQPPKAPAL